MLFHCQSLTTDLGQLMQFFSRQRRGVALLTAFAPSILAAMATGLTAIGSAGVAALNAIRIAVMANPLGALAVAITTVVAVWWR